MRTVNFTVNDGALNSLVASRGLTVSAVNSAPTISGVETVSLAYVEDNAPMSITASALVSDVDSINLTSATVKISTGFKTAEDVLSFTNTLTITGAWDQTTGILTLTGTDTVAKYQTALLGIKYSNISQKPSVTGRTIAFQVYDGALWSTVTTRALTVTAVNDAPVISALETNTLMYDGTTAIPITTQALVTDAELTQMTSASVQISTNYQNGKDSLTYTAVGAIIFAWNAGSGTLTMTGSDSLANYQKAFRAVKFQCNQTSYTPIVRTLTLLVNDGQVNSLPVTRQVAMTPISPPSALTLVYRTDKGMSLSWTAPTVLTLVSGYNVYLNGALATTVSTTTASIAGLTPATIYSVTVRSKDSSSGESLPTDPLVMSTRNDVTPPSKPSAVTATSVGTTVTLNWNASTDNVGVARYSIEHDTTLSGSDRTTLSESVIDLTFQHAGQIPGSLHNYYLFAYDAAGNRSDIAVIKVLKTPDSIPPSIPLNLQGTATGAGQVTLTWSASTDNISIPSYRVYRDSNNYTSIGVTGLTYVYQGLTPSSTYKFEVDAVDSSGNYSAKSAFINVTTLPTSTPDVTPPSQPGAPYIELDYYAQYDSISISWVPSTDNISVNGYTVYQNGNVVASPTWDMYRNYRVGNLIPGTAYQFKIAARDAAGNESAASPETTLRTLEDVTAPNKPSRLSLISRIGAVPVIGWSVAATDDHSGVANYEILVGNAVKSTVAAPATSATVTGLVANATYAIKVRAVDRAGIRSENSETLTIKTDGDLTPPATPTGLAVSLSSVSSAALTWSASTDDVAIAGYQVQLNGIIVSAITTNRTFTATRLLYNTQQNFSVRAVDTSGNLSSWSPAQTVTTPVHEFKITAITGFVATRTKPFDNVLLTWETPTVNGFVKSYRIYRYEGSDPPSIFDAPTAEVSDTSWRDTSSISKNKAKYFIVPTDGGGRYSSLQSQTITFSRYLDDTQRPSKPGPPSLKTYYPYPDVRVHWGPSYDDYGIDYYNIYRDGQYVTKVYPEDTYEYFDTSSSTINRYKPHVYQVQAIDDAGHISELSNPVTLPAFVDTIPPTTPSQLWASNQTPTSLYLNWTSSRDDNGSGIAGYRIYVNNILREEVTQPYCHLNTGLTPDTVYALCVEAVDKAGNTARSSILNTRTDNIAHGLYFTIPATAVEPTSLSTTINIRAAVVGVPQADTAIVYSWIKKSGPGTTTFTSNNSNAAQSTTLSVSKTGTYVLTCTATYGTASVSIDKEIIFSPVRFTQLPGVSPSPMTTTSANVSALAASWWPEADTIYSWSMVSGPAPVTFAVNDSNAAKNSVANFTYSGSYVLKCTATTHGSSVSANITVKNEALKFTFAAQIALSQTLGNSANVSALATGDGVLSDITYTWSMISGPAPVTFAAFGTNAAKQTSVTFIQPGAYVLRCTGTRNGMSAISEVSIDVPGLRLFRAAKIDPDPVLMTATAIASALAIGVCEETDIQYLWSKVSGPAEVIIFDNGTNAAKNATISFIQAGTYQLLCTATYQTFSVTSEVTFDVQWLSWINKPVAQWNATSGKIEVSALAHAFSGNDQDIIYQWYVITGPALPWTSNNSQSARLSSAVPDQAGDYKVMCSAQIGGLVIDGMSTVNVPSGGATSWAILPNTALVEPGAVQHFTIQAVDRFGSPASGVAPSVLWSAQGGTITTSGAFTAGPNAGTYTVSATDETVTKTASVSVPVIYIGLTGSLLERHTNVPSAPGGVWSGAPSSVTALLAIGPRRLTIKASDLGISGGKVTLKVNATANAKVTFVCLSDGSFLNGQGSILSVTASSNGTAVAELLVGQESIQEVIVGSPACRGSIRFVVVKE